MFCAIKKKPKHFNKTKHYMQTLKYEPTFLLLHGILKSTTKYQGVFQLFQKM